jgi:Spy/CpxP family protein refolding chaperone
MRISVVKIALAISLVFNLSVLGAAGYFHYSKSNYWVSPLGGTMQKDKFLFEELALSPEQKKKMREGSITCRAEIDGKRRQIEVRRKHLFSLMRAERPDVPAVRAAVAEISGIRQEMEWLAVSRIIGVKASLEKDQQGKFLDLIENSVSKGSKTGCPTIMGTDRQP